MSASQILFGLVRVESAASFAEARSEVYKKWKVWSTQMRVAGGVWVGEGGQPPGAVRCHRDKETEWRGQSLCGDDTSKLEMSR